MLFILFDIEVIFLFPIAVQLRAFGSFAVSETVVFVVSADDRLRLRLAPGSARMEIKRERLDGPGPPSEFRSRQMLARDMLNGDLEGDALERYAEKAVMTTTLDKAVAWSRGNSLYPLTFGLACCAIEQITAVGARMDIARFGWEAFRASPRQADLIILSGRVSIKMAPVIRRLYDQMLDPKWAISMGACCSSDGRVQQLRPRARRQVHADRCPRARLPAPARGAHVRRDEAAGQDHEGPRPRLARALQRLRDRGGSAGGRGLGCLTLRASS